MTKEIPLYIIEQTKLFKEKLSAYDMACKSVGADRTIEQLKECSRLFDDYRSQGAVLALCVADFLREEI